MTTPKPANPFRGLPANRFWQSVTDSAPGGLNPVVDPKFVISQTDKVATLGSCFAQRIATHIQKRGANYLVTEQAPEGLSPTEAALRNFGLYSARYGNVYTVRQARQLLDRAFGRFTPADAVWRYGSTFVDALRPQIEPNGFATVADVESARGVHLAAVRAAFEQADVVVFTLGLTEGWLSRRDGTAYPLAPGVRGGAYDEAEHEFVNPSVIEVIDDLSYFVDGLREVNPQIRVLLTVTPQPILATYQNSHVLVANTLCRAVLRVAATEVSQSRGFVDYFPSYEIVAGSPLGARYYEPDLRTITPVGIDYVMRVFDKSFLAIDEDVEPGYVPPINYALADVICDEDAITASLVQPEPAPATEPEPEPAPLAEAEPDANERRSAQPKQGAWRFARGLRRWDRYR